MMPSIEQYRMFVAVAESNSLREAAEKVFKTQPTVTSAIKKMEQSLGVILFNRDQYRMQLTDVGNKVYQLAIKLLATEDEIKHFATQIRIGNEPLITIAIEASFDLSSILAVLEYAQTHYKSTQIILQQEYMSGAFEKLMMEQADFAISPMSSFYFPTGKVEMKFINQGQFICVASPKFLTKLTTINSVNELINEYQIVVKDSGTKTENIDIGVQQGQRIWYVNNFEAKLLLIKQGMGWGTLPMSLVKDLITNNELSRLELNDFQTTKKVDYHLLKLSKKNLGPVAKKIWQMF